MGEANAVKVRRVLQLTEDLAGPLDGLRILDLGCGEGVYAIEAALGGATVLAVDAREERMREGREVAERHGIGGVEFQLRDAREVTRERDGGFDAVWCLGLLYHLDSDDALALLEESARLAGRLLVVDTLVAERTDASAERDGRTYRGTRVREHEDGDTPEVRRARLLRSIDNSFAFRFDPESLVRAIGDAGFSSVLECRLPPEPGKAADRVTLAAVPGELRPLATYPWINGLDDEAIAGRLGGA